MLNENMIKLISQHTLGFVATIDNSGRPNLSPKGTFVVLDNENLMFSEIRSPNTIRNIQTNPELEVNFVDPFARKGVRIKGKAEIIEKENSEYEELFPHFAQWGDLTTLIRRIVKIKVTQAKEISSPIYDIGAVEQDLVKLWWDKFADINGIDKEI